MSYCIKPWRCDSSTVFKVFPQFLLGLIVTQLNNTYNVNVFINVENFWYSRITVPSSFLESDIAGTLRKCCFQLTDFLPWLFGIVSNHLSDWLKQGFIKARSQTLSMLCNCVESETTPTEQQSFLTHVLAQGYQHPPCWATCSYHAHLK